MDEIKSYRHGTYYPFRYYIKWEMSKKRTEFGVILREKWNAICETIEKENEIFLDAYYLTSAFDCVYFSLSSVPKLAPAEVVGFVKNGVYNIITAKYPHLRAELFNDPWYPIDKRHNYSKMDYIAYYYRFNVKRDETFRREVDILDTQINGTEVKKIVEKAISIAVDNYNKSHEKPVDILMCRCPDPESVELIMGCPISVSASHVIGRIKGSSSNYIGKNYPQFSDRSSPYYVHTESFWAPSNFFALSRRYVETISRDKLDYLKLQTKWHEAIKEENPNLKGKLLELFVFEMVNLMKNFEILKGENGSHDINLGFEQIDLTIKNKSPILERMGPLLKVECKNWKDKIGNPELRDFSGKLRGEIHVGILISVNGFGKDIKPLLERLYFNERKIIVTISGEEIEEWLNDIIDGFNKGASERDDLETKLENKIFSPFLRLN